MKSQIISSVRLSGSGHECQKNNFTIVSKKLVIAALLAVSVSSFAQDQVQGDKKADKPKRERMSPEQREQAMLDRMTKELSLTAQQQEQIKPILAEQNAKLEAMRAQRAGADQSKQLTDADKDALRAKRQEDKKATDAKLQAILTPDQFKKMKANEAAARDRMREGRGNGNWGGNRGNNGGTDNGGGNDNGGGSNNDMN